MIAFGWIVDNLLRRMLQYHHLWMQQAAQLAKVYHLQVSDREWLSGRPETEARLKNAEAMVADGREEDIAYRDFEIDGAPISARRCVALSSMLLRPEQPVLQCRFLCICAVICLGGSGCMAILSGKSQSRG